jgi:two-component system, LytTR family, sensor kinase
MRRVLTVLGAWTAVALLFAIQTRFQGDTPRPGSWIIGWQLAGWWTWAAFTPLVTAFSHRAARLGTPLRIVAAHIPAALAVAVLCAATEGAVKWALGIYRTTPLSLGAGVSYAVATYWTFNVLIYAMVVGLYHAVRAARLESQLMQARLDALTGQLQPHFLFNTLHTISAFVLEDPKQANRMITRLSELLRHSFSRDRGPLVTLEEELQLLDHYVAIQEARFGDRLKVTFRVEAGTGAAMVPTFLLQPLVENAIRHGAARPGRVAEIDIAAVRAGERLRLEVRDNGPGVPEGGPAGRNGGGGVGIANTQARLAQLYGVGHRFELANAPGGQGGAIATVEIPYRDHAYSHR